MLLPASPENCRAQRWRPLGADSHAVSDEVATLAAWSRDQRRGDWTLGDLVMLSLRCRYETAIPCNEQVFGVDYLDLDGTPDRREPRVTLGEALARGWDGALFREEQRWWRNHWIGVGWAEDVLAERMR